MKKIRTFAMFFLNSTKEKTVTKVAYFSEHLSSYITSGPLSGASVSQTSQVRDRHVVITDCRKLKCMRLGCPISA